MTAMLMISDERSITLVARSVSDRYGSPQVMAKSMIGCRNPTENLAHRRPHYDCRRFFYARRSVLWRLCVGGIRACRVPNVPVYQPAHSCHPFAW